MATAHMFCVFHESGTKCFLVSLLSQQSTSQVYHQPPFWMKFKHVMSAEAKQEQSDLRVHSSNQHIQPNTPNAYRTYMHV